jgi:flagellar hook-associated protein 1 FlgK
MGVLNVLQSGKSGMNTSKAGIATAGHNISNANTDGYSRQRVQVEADVTKQMSGGGGPYIGSGSKLSRVERVNDQYIERQMRDGGRELAHYEEKKVFLGQMEDVFNEMNGDGLNRLVSRFFNDFRKLSNEPSSEAIRNSVRESSEAMIRDFKRIRTELESIRTHVDSRIDGSMKELNGLAHELKDINIRIQAAEISGHEATDLNDRRDVLVRKMCSYADVSAHKDNQGMVTVDVKGVGPLVTGQNVESYHVNRAPARDDTGAVENSLQISRSAYSKEYITEQFQNGKLGALIEVRDRTIAAAINRLDQLAHAVSGSVNEIHQKGYTQDGGTGVAYFKPLNGITGAASMLNLSDEVKSSAGNIAAGMSPHASGDNRGALAIANLQNARFLNGGQTTVDDFYNAIVADVGVTSARNNEALGQQRNIVTQLGKMRDQVSGVSIDEEITNLMQHQHAFDASARVIKVADDMLDTILRLKG